MQDKGQKTTVKNALEVDIDLEVEAHAASTGVDINTLGEAKDWNYSDCNGQVHNDINTRGMLVLLAFFRAADHVSSEKPFHVVSAKWNCSMVDKQSHSKISQRSFSHIGQCGRKDKEEGLLDILTSTVVSSLY
jgi:hypothetical protein